jgi:hypothetical protein
MTGKFIDAETEGYNIKCPRVFSEEHRKKLGLAKKGKTISEEHKKNVSLGKKGKPSGTLGKKFNIGSDHPRAKLTEEQAQYIIDNKGIIIQKDLAKELGVCMATITKIHGNTLWTHLPRTKENTK